MRYLKKINYIAILIILIFNFCFPIISAAVDETVTIQFEDENLYNAIVEKIPYKITSKNDSTHTIKIIQSNINSIYYLDFENKGIEKLNGIEKFTNLQRLYLDYNKISDITSLENLVNLNELYLSNNKITDITPLSKLVKLKDLWLEYNKITDIVPLGNLVNLKMLSLYQNSIVNITPLGKLVNLVDLRLINNQITDITPLGNLVNLKVLYLYKNQITDITPLGNLVNLNALYLAENPITDITPLGKLVNLSILSLSDNQITDITPLGKLVNLNRLSLTKNPITEITPLGNLVNLKFLDLSNNQITNISALGNLVNLETLWLSNNQIIDIIALNKLINLKRLFLHNNKICDMEINDNIITQLIDYSFKNQYLSMTTKTKEVQLPKIFMQEQSATNELKLVNCKLNEDRTKVILNNNIKKAEVRIQNGKFEGSKLEITYNDSVAPILNINYSTKAITKEQVTVTITANKKIKKVEGWTLSSDETKLTKVYTENATEKVKVYDLDGNEAEANISINNINKKVNQEADKPSTPNEVPKTDNTVAPNKIPQTGQSGWIVGSITVVIVIIVILVVRYKKYKDIK